MSSPKNAKQPVFVFVLGPPCAGKSTLCKALSKRYNFDHFSIGEETRSLISSQSTGPAARIKPRLSPAELDIFTQNLKAGNLGLIHNTIKYIKERMFPDDVVFGELRLLVDGFPRKVDRWEALKECGRDMWQPGGRTFAIILDVDKEVAYDRFVSRGRPGDVFDKRFEEHIKSIQEIIEAMQTDGAKVIRFSVKEGLTTEELMHQLDDNPAWTNTATQSYHDLSVSERP